MPAQLNLKSQLLMWAIRPWVTRQLSQAAANLAPVYRGQGSYFWRGNRSSVDLATELRREARFMVVQAAWVLSSPTNQDILNVAQLLLGAPQAEGLEILVDAIIIAGSPGGSQQRREAEGRAAVAAGRFIIQNPFLG